MKKTLEQALLEFKNKHGDKFDYSRVIYLNIDTPVEIICPIHGIFTMTPYGHIKSKHGCLKCGIKNYITLDDLIVKCNDKHGDKFVYDFSNLEKDRTIDVTCVKHKSKFKIKWFNHIHQDNGGCKFCLTEHKRNTLKSDISVLKDRMASKHDYFYDYSMITDYENQHIKQPIKCPSHGIFYQSIITHLRGHGCKICANTVLSEVRRKSQDDFISQCNNVHDNKYIYSKIKYKNADTKITITCPIHGDFEQIANNHLKGSGCVRCSSSKSKSSFEERLGLLFDSFGIEYLTNVRPSWLNGKELDLLVPSLSLAIEFNGSVYHHSSLDTNSDFMHSTYKDSFYHHSKYLKCKEKSIDLIHIFQFEDFDMWLEKIRNIIIDRDANNIYFHNIRRRRVVNNKELVYFGKSYITIKKL